MVQLDMTVEVEPWAIWTFKLDALLNLDCYLMFDIDTTNDYDQNEVVKKS